MIDRYRNPQVLTSARIETLVKINKVKNLENLEVLQKRYNDIENCIRNLESLKTESSTYGYLLIPLLKEKNSRGTKYDYFSKIFWKCLDA